MEQYQRDPPRSDHASESRSEQLQVEEAITLTYQYPAFIDTNQKTLTASITLMPHKHMPNLPVEVEIRGYSLLQSFPMSSKSQQMEITESLLFEDEEKAQQKPMMRESVYIERGKNLEKQGEDEQQGEYFLEGCQVLFQLQERSQQRLQQLQADKVYVYPIEFNLPSNLPVSMDHRLLKKTHITIRYCLQIKISYLKEDKVHNHTLTLPFDIKQPPKVYPFQELVLNQKIRCYHQQAKTKDNISRNVIVQLAKCICPQPVLKCLIPNLQIYSTRFAKYDLYHIEVLAVVNKNHTLFLTVRAYKEPEQGSLTVNRKKRTADNLNQTKELALGEVPPDVSIASIKENQQHPTELMVHKVEVQMIAQLVGLERQVVFTKMICLSRWNYDMLEGQGMVHLKEYLDYPHCCLNQLFELRFSFKARPFFQEEENSEDKPFQSFVVEQTVRALDL